MIGEQLEHAAALSECKAVKSETADMLTMVIKGICKAIPLMSADYECPLCPTMLRGP